MTYVRRDEMTRLREEVELMRKQCLAANRNTRSLVKELHYELMTELCGRDFTQEVVK
jgi:hypothetical protein